MSSIYDEIRRLGAANAPYRLWFKFMQLPLHST